MKDDFHFHSKIEDLYIKKLIKDQRETKKEREALAKRLKENKPVDIPDTLLGKRGLALDERKYQTEKLLNNFMFNGPEIKLKYRVELAKDFLNRVPIDDNGVEPDIMKLNLNDIHSVTTCIEVDHMMKVLIVGTNTGSIQAFFFSEDQTNFEEPEPIKLVKTGNNINQVENEEEVKQVDENLKIVLEARP